MGIVPLACGGAIRDGGETDSGQGARAGSSGKDPGKQLPPIGTSGGPGISMGTGGSFAMGTAGGPVVGTGGSIVIGPSGDGGTSGVLWGITCTHSKLDESTGLVSCDEGYSHRPAATECSRGNIGGAPSEGGATGEGGVAGDSGVVDPYDLPRVADNAYVPCAGADIGACSKYQWGYCRGTGIPEQPHCVSGCVSDSDCGAGFVCLCGNTQSPTGGACTPSQCRTDAECGSGSLCASYQGTCGGIAFACLSTSDACRTQNECQGGCEFNSAVGRRTCNSAVCGRPFLVDEQARVAATVRDTSWSVSLDASPDVSSLSPFQRAAEAARWTRMGQLEHASIAAFARFTLQLLSLGAPPELVEACTAALADETAHARLCFRIASAYAGHAVGPGPLDITGSLTPSSLAEIVDLVIAEGCFGETIATLDAQEAAEESTDPVIAAAFTRIAQDEQRHAELAFRFLRWAIDHDPAVVRTHITRAIDSCLDHSSGARDVVIPCLLDLLRAHSLSLEIAS